MASWFYGEEHWHVRAEYRALMLLEEEWIGEWEFGTTQPWHPCNRPPPAPGSIGAWNLKRGAWGGRWSECDPDVGIGDWRHYPIDESSAGGGEAAQWVADHWLPDEAEARMARRWNERLALVDARCGTRPRRKGRPGKPPGSPGMQQDVYLAVMVAFLVYAGLLATGHKGGARPSRTACEVVADETGLKLRYVTKQWENYKKFLPSRGENPEGFISDEQGYLLGLHEKQPDEVGNVRKGIPAKLWPRVDDSERRREFYSRIFLDKNDFPVGCCYASRLYAARLTLPDPSASAGTRAPRDPGGGAPGRRTARPLRQRHHRRGAAPCAPIRSGRGRLRPLRGTGFSITGYRSRPHRAGSREPRHTTSI